MISSCYIACNASKEEPICQSYCFFTAMEITNLVIGLLAFLNVGAFKNYSYTTNMILFSGSFVTLFIDICTTIWMHTSSKKAEKIALKKSLISQGIKLEVSDKGYVLNLGNQKDYLTKRYIVVLGNSAERRTYPVRALEKAKPEILGINQYLFYLKKSEGGIEDVCVRFKRKTEGEITQVFDLSLNEWLSLRLDYSKLTHLDPPIVSEPDS